VTQRPSGRLQRRIARFYRFPSQNRPQSDIPFAPKRVAGWARKKVVRDGGGDRIVYRTLAETVTLGPILDSNISGAPAGRNRYLPALDSQIRVPIITY